MAMIRTVSLLVVTLAFSAVSRAAPVTYTDPTAFFAALPGPATTLDFESQALPTTINDGDTIDGITFNHGLADFGITMEVTDGDQFGGGGPFLTTSGSQFLGTSDLDLFLDYDSFSLSFGPVNAIGLYFITADVMFPNDITLTAGGATASLNPTDASFFNDETFDAAYFLGIIDTMNTFTLAEIAAFSGEVDANGDPDPAFFFNVDDITTAVAVDIPAIPLPGAAWLFLTALAGLGFMRRKAV